MQFFVVLNPFLETYNNAKSNLYNYSELCEINNFKFLEKNPPSQL